MTPEEEKIKLGLKEYNPNDEVGVRSLLTNQYGINNDDIGWNDLGDNGGTITFKGQDFMNIGENQLKNNSSFASASSLADAIKNYSSTYGYDFGNGNSPTSSIDTMQSNFNTKYSGDNDPTTREYDNPYSQNLNSLYQKIMNYEYDPENDPTYQALESKYTKNGNKAMQDTMSAASTLTGGRLNSYGQTAGQGVYNDYMSELTDYIPDLAESGLSKLYSQMDMTQGLDNTAYNRFSNERSYDTGNMQWDSEQLRAALADQQSAEQYQNEWDYNVGRDQLADQRYNTEWDYNVQQDALDRQDSLRRSYGSGSSTTTDPSMNVQTVAAYNALKKDFAQGGAEGSEAIQYLADHYDELVERHGADAVKMFEQELLGGGNEETPMTLDDQILAEKLRGERIDNDSKLNPEVDNSDVVYGSIMQSFSGLSDSEVLNELVSYPQDYVADLGQDTYNDLVKNYRSLAETENETKTASLEEIRDSYMTITNAKTALEAIKGDMNEIIAKVGQDGYEELLTEFTQAAEDRTFLQKILPGGR